MRKLIAAATAALLVAGCGTALNQKAPARQAGPMAAKTTIAKPKAPTDAFLRITYVTANGLMGSSFTAPPNYHVRLRAYTTADFNAQLDWTWRAWGPIFGFREEATWTTPMMDGTYTVDVQVRDRDNGWDWKTLYFRIQKDAKLAEAALTEAEKAAAKQAE